MSVTAIVLVLASAFVHAAWNLLGKRSGANATYFCVASAAAAVILSPILIVWSEAVVRIPQTVWAYLVVTGFFQALYFTGLAGAYRHGDLSVVYPVARAFPVLIVPAVSATIGAGESPTVLALVGMVVVAAGLLVIPQGRLGRPNVSELFGTWLAFAFLAGVGTSGYSIVDDAALSIYREVLAAHVGSAHVRAPIVYSVFQLWSTAVFLSGFALVAAGGPRRFVFELRRTPLVAAATTGLAVVTAYCLVLAAYGFARDVSYVVAFRQISLPIGGLLGILYLGETASAARVAGTVLIVSGLVAVALG